MIGFHLLFAISILLFFKSLFVAHSTPSEINTKPISEKRFNRLIYLVMDGLRFDAFIPVNKQGRYYNNMTIGADPDVESRCFLTIAGIPTATSVRVVSLMTGAPTNPLEILQTFTPHSIRLDTLIRKSPPDISFFGDECWTKLFESLAGHSSAMPSYSRLDQAGREDELMSLLIDRITSTADEESGQFTFVHFNTLDTYGHAFGVNHDTVKETLERWNDYLYRIYNAMDENTLFVALSDHGVTDEGQHGGSSKEELAAFSCFFTKGRALGSNVLDNRELSSYYQFMRKFYNIDRCNTDGDWIAAKTPYNIIHQDDIILTISYLLGIPPPFNAYGNLIPFIVRDPRALKELAVLKEGNPLTGTTCRPGEGDASSYERYNYLLTEKIYTNLSSRSWCGGFIVLLIALFLLHSHRYIEGLDGFVMAIFIIFMVSHSLFAFASEDYLWLAALLCDTPSLANLLAAGFYIKTPRKMTMERDRISFSKRWGLLSLDEFSGIKEPIVLSGLFILAKSFNIRRIWACCTRIKMKSAMKDGFALRSRNIINRHFVNEILYMAPQLYYIIYSIASKREDRELKISLLSSDPALRSLLAIHNQPVNALYILLFMNNLDTSGSSSALYSALAFIPYCSSLDKMLQSIDYETFFIYADGYNPLLAGVSGFAYLILPRLRHLWRLSRSPPARRRSFRFINLIGLYTAFACSWAQFGHLTFQNYFINRLFFVTFFTIIDILGLSILETWTGFFSK